MSPSFIETCPHCGSDLRGEEIPVDVREWYGGAARGSRLVAVYSRELDRTTHFQCPDCEKRIDRSTAYRASD